MKPGSPSIRTQYNPYIIPFEHGSCGVQGGAGTKRANLAPIAVVDSAFKLKSLESQSTPNNGPHRLHFEVKTIVFGTL